MIRYAAFLRGLNLGRRRLKMDRLREAFEAVPCVDEAATYRASGNVVFRTPAEDPSELETRIEFHLADELGYEVTTLLRPVDALRDIASPELFADAPPGPGDKVHVVFMRASAFDSAAGALEALATDGDLFRVRGREAYWLRRGRLSDSPITTTHMEDAFSSSAITMRTLGTVRGLAEKFS